MNRSHQQIDATPRSNYLAGSNQSLLFPALEDRINRSFDLAAFSMDCIGDPLPCTHLRIIEEFAVVFGHQRVRTVGVDGTIACHRRHNRDRMPASEALR